jgi:hypothetical protein
MKSEAKLKRQFLRLLSSLDERGRRGSAASEAMALGRGGIARVHRATGLALRTISKGIRALKAAESGPVPDDGSRRVRRPGRGRKRKIGQDPTLLLDLAGLVEPVTRGDPETPLRWTLKSLRRLASELVVMGHQVSYRTVGRLLKGLGLLPPRQSQHLGGSKPSRPKRAVRAHQLASGATTCRRQSGHLG